jgi:hypothetical protein
VRPASGSNVTCWAHEIVRRVTLALYLIVLPACARGVSAQQAPGQQGGFGHGGAPPQGAPAATVARAAGAPSPRTPEQILRAARQSLYVVGTPAGNSTGFCIKNGRVVTSLQGVLGHSAIWVTDAQGQKRQVTSVRAFDSDHDLAILDAGVALSPGLELAQPELPAAGAPVVVLGNPQSAPNAVANAVVGNVRTVSPTLSLLQIDGPIPQGSAGGPVLSADGKVVGVLIDSYATGKSPSFAVPIRYLKERLARTKIWITMSTFAAITAPALPPPRWLSTASERKPQAFPISVAGFAFGMSIPDAEHACNGKLTGDPSFATCSFEPVDIPFANNNVSIRFESGRLTRVYLRGNSWDDVTRAMLAKYGKPGLVEARNGGSWDPSAGWKKGTPSRATWWLDGGMLVVFSQDGRDLALIYTSTPQERTTGTAR